VKLSWFTKSRRAQNTEDFETWLQGGVTPTLNAFDNANENRATVLILSVDIYNASMDENNFQTVKAGGGITSMPSVLIIDGTRVGDVRVYEDQVMQTVIKRWGTGGGNVPMIFEDEEPTTIAFDTQFGSNANTFENVSPTLKASQQPPSFIEVEPIVMRDREGCAGGGKGPLLSDKAFTLASSNFHTLFPNSATVRRLTPTECERLQGFPDGWTGEQADSNRYKQMGNAVAVPVVQWIINNVVGDE
jgi:site-specific DNA-cytosine methylase